MFKFHRYLKKYQYIVWSFYYTIGVNASPFINWGLQVRVVSINPKYFESKIPIKDFYHELQTR